LKIEPNSVVVELITVEKLDSYSCCYRIASGVDMKMEAASCWTKLMLTTDGLTCCIETNSEQKPVIGEVTAWLSTEKLTTVTALCCCNRVRDLAQPRNQDQLKLQVLVCTEQEQVIMLLLSTIC
jgi:hypothetical protein